MIPVKHIDPDDLALYAMQLLSPEETAEMSQNLQYSVEARQVLAEFQSDLSLYALTAEMHAPSPLSRERLMNQVTREKKPVPADHFAQQAPQPLLQRAPEEPPVSAFARGPVLVQDEPRRRGMSRVLPWAGWALAAGLAVTTGVLYQQHGQMRNTILEQNAQLEKTSADAAQANAVLAAVKDPLATRVTLTGAERPVPQGRVTYVAKKGTLIFLASNLQPLQENKTYELWLIPANGHAPIPAGTFQPDLRGNASVLLPELPLGVPAKAFGITIEEIGGSASPTLPIILKGAVS